MIAAKEDGDMKELAIDATSRLKQTVMNEREVKLRLMEENEQLKVTGSHKKPERVNNVGS